LPALLKLDQAIPDDTLASSACPARAAVLLALLSGRDSAACFSEELSIVLLRFCPRLCLTVLAVIALAACVTRSGSLTQAQIETLRIRDISFENVVPASPERFHSGTALLKAKLIDRLGARYDPSAADGYRLVIAITEAYWPPEEGTRTGGESGSLKGIARLLPPKGDVPLTTYDISATQSPPSAGGGAIGLIVGAAMSNVIRMDYRDRVTTFAANGLIQSMLSP
jgi:hypothetical protein